MKTVKDLDPGHVFFMCPGCGEGHRLRVTGNERPRWTFNGNYEKPTFNPSILATWEEPSDKPGEFDDESKNKKLICHSFVRDGKIQFLNDCTHASAGMTLDLPPVA